MSCCGSKKPEERKSIGKGIQIASQKNENQKLEAKIILVGSSGVGKTCIATTYKEGKFTSGHIPTVGAAYFQKKFAFPDGSTLKLHIWDTAGQDRFKSIAPLYYKDAHAALVVYAIDDEPSFTAVSAWIDQLDEHANVPKMVKFLIGNKSDVDKDRRKVMIKDGKKYSEQQKMEFFETSAKVNDGSINDVFSTMANHIRKTF